MKKFMPLILTGILFLTGCKSESICLLSTTISQIEMKTNGHLEQLHDYDSPYTICYKNEDNTYSMYIFASPIQYQTNNGYTIIDNTVIESNKLGFAFENRANSIKTYFPKALSNPLRVENGSKFLEFKPNWDITGFSDAKKTVFTNMYGDKVSAVIYKRNDMDLVFYPTKAGIKSEIILKETSDNNEFSFIVKTNAASSENKQNGYILFKDGDEIQSIIYQPLVFYNAEKGQQVDLTVQMEINRASDNYHVVMIADQNIISNAKAPYVRLDPSFEMYLNKMPDSTVYSKRNVNNYLANYAVVGEHPVTGSGWHYLRLRLNYILYTKEENIISSAYYIRNLYSIKESHEVFMYQAKQQWSSTRLTWEDRIESKKVISVINPSEKGFYLFKITDFVQECVNDTSWETESLGVLLKSESSYHILTTSDNAMYSPYIKLILSKMPRKFDPRDDINEVLY